LCYYCFSTEWLQIVTLSEAKFTSTCFGLLTGPLRESWTNSRRGIPENLIKGVKNKKKIYSVHRVSFPALSLVARRKKNTGNESISPWILNPSATCLLSQFIFFYFCSWVPFKLDSCLGRK